MTWLISYREQLYSHLPPAEILRRLETSLLPADAPLWRDDYQPAATLLFQGSVVDSTCHLLRFGCEPAGREVGPFPIQGRVSPHGAGSSLSLRYYIPREGWHLMGFVVALVSMLVLGATATVWYHSRRFPWFSLAVLGTLPLWVMASSYFSLHQEATKSRPLLVELLQLWSLPPM